MGLLSVIAAALGSFVFGSIWYSILAKQWMAASGVEVVDGAPANQKDPMPYIMGVIASILVAGMMRHAFATGGVDTLAKGIMSGFGIGLFLVTPWIITCYGFAGRPRQLMVIDGGYATFGCTVMGAILMLL